MEALYILLIEPLLWSLIVFFVLQTMIHAFTQAPVKAKKYAIVTSVLIFLLMISDDIARMPIWYR